MRMKRNTTPSAAAFIACEECQREYEDQIEMLEMRLSNEHPGWSMVRLHDRALIEHGKGARVQEGAS